MTLALLSIGTEITRGELVDTNSQWLAEALTDRGHEVTEMATVDDHTPRIVEALSRLAEFHQAIVCTGGLGPTTDDLTTSAAAALLGVPLVRHADSLELIRARFAAHGRSVTPSDEKQADFPEGALVLPNDRGTAPGFSAAIGKSRAFFLPGVPHEMRAMFEAEVLPRLPEPSKRIAAVRLRTFGLPESEVNDRLRGVEDELDVLIGYRASFPEIEVKVLSSRDSAVEAEGAARTAADEVKRRLGEKIVYGEGAKASLPQTVGSLLAERGLTLGLAESCTGGLVSESITAVPGASAYYRGGICSYANEVKQNLLGVPRETLERSGAVSEETARAMAEGARRALGVDVALAITGIAGPSGGTEEKPVGLVHWAVATAERTVAKHRVFPARRWQVQKLAAWAGLASIRLELLGLLTGEPEF